MSYDLQLYRKDKTKRALTKEELETLDKVFITSIHFTDDQGLVDEFSVKYKQENVPDWVEDGFRFVWQNKGYFWTYISYSANEEMWEYFNDLVNDVALELDLTIVNPQVGEEDPKDEKKILHEAIAKDEQKKNEQYNRILNNPAKFVFDFQIEIRSWPVQEKSCLILYANEDQMYRGTVGKSEKLIDKLQEIVPVLIGDNDYTISSINEVPDFKAKEITNNPLLRIVIETNYFDPRTRNLRYDMSWSDLRDLVI
jgi:hypothetical protein